MGGRKTLLTAGTHGILWKLDRTNGAFLGFKEVDAERLAAPLRTSSRAGSWSTRVISRGRGSWTPTTPDCDRGI